MIALGALAFSACGTNPDASDNTNTAATESSQNLPNKFSQKEKNFF